MIRPRVFFYGGALALIGGAYIQGGAGGALIATFVMSFVLGLGEVDQRRGRR